MWENNISRFMACRLSETEEDKRNKVQRGEKKAKLMKWVEKKDEKRRRNENYHCHRKYQEQKDNNWSHLFVCRYIVQLF